MIAKILIPDELIQDNAIVLSDAISPLVSSMKWFDILGEIESAQRQAFSAAIPDEPLTGFCERCEKETETAIFHGWNGNEELCNDCESTARMEE